MTANIYAHLDTARKTNMADSIASRFGAALSGEVVEKW